MVSITVKPTPTNVPPTKPPPGIPPTRPPPGSSPGRPLPPPGSPPTRPGCPTIPGPGPVPFLSHIGKGGHRALWVGFVVFLISTLVIAVLASRQQKKHRLFYLLTMLITGIATLSYYAMATGSGSTYVELGWQLFQGQNTLVFRQVLWAREVDWALTTPLLLLDLGLLAGLSWLDILSLLIVDEAMVLTGLFSALQPGRAGAKWGWYTFSCLFFIYILYALLWEGRKCAKGQHTSVSGLYTQLSIYTLILWLLYPIIFALGEGAGRISPNAETVAYTVVDILTKIVFAFWLLFKHKHDSESECAVGLADSWTEPRCTGSGAVQLPADDH